MNKHAILFLLVSVIGTILLLVPGQLEAQKVRVKVTAEQANLRERPDIGSAIVQQIPEGAVLEADRKEGEWYLVRYTLEDGGVIAGYIHESLVLVTTQEAGPPVKAAAEPRQKARAPEPARAPRPAGPVSQPFEFSVSLLGGPVNPSDLNNGAQGLVDSRAASLGLEPTGSADPVRMAAGLGLELTYRISPQLAVGLGADHFRGGNASKVAFTGAGLSETLALEPAFQALPFKINVRFYPGRDFYIRGGLGAYHVRAGYLYRFENQTGWRQWKGSATAWAFGAEAAFGGDWKVGRNTYFFAEAGFRLARWSGLKGKDVYSDSALGDLTKEGTLYAWKQAVGASSYPLLYVRESRPSGTGISGARAAEITLTGTALRAGLRFRY